MNPLTQSKNTTILPVLIALILGCFALSPTARAVTPAPDGGYPNNNTAEGDSALFSLTTGTDNTALGFQALWQNMFGNGNTAVGSNTLYSCHGGSDNTAVGISALLGGTDVLTNVDRNTAVGAYALANNVGDFDNDGFDNTAIGAYALYTNVTGFDNTAIGSSALYGNVDGFQNTAIGRSSLASNTSGYANTATGEFAMADNSTGVSNTASGYFALLNNTTGSSNTAIGGSALIFNTSASNNTAVGQNALYANTTGNNNTASGSSALLSNTTGIKNTANGVDSLFSNTTGNYNAAHGQGALYSNTIGRNNTACGQNAMRNNTTGSFNVALGENAGLNLTTGSNNIEIGNRGVASETKTIRIGTKGTQTATFMAGVSGATVAGGVGVIIDTNGHLGTVVSSERFKEEIRAMDKASEAILSLQPVTFHYKKDLDPEGIPQFGLVAEQVEKVSPALVARDADGKPYTVRYEAVNAMLLNEFLKARRQIDAQQKQIEALTAGLQKVSAQLEASKPAPQVVNNP